MRQTLVLSFAIAALCACGKKESKYPGELGAPCTTAADCGSGLLCTKDYAPAKYTYFYCFKACDNTPTSCPAGSFCSMAQFTSDPRFVCERECADLKFCEDLHPDATACKEFTGNPTGKKSCGIGG